MIDKINCIGQKLKCPYCEKEFTIKYVNKLYKAPNKKSCVVHNLKSLEYKLVVSCSYCERGIGEVDKNGDFVLDSKEFVEFMKQKEIEISKNIEKYINVVV